MPPLIAVLIAGAGLYGCYRALSSMLGADGDNSSARGPRDVNSTTDGEQDMGRLEPDPVTGIYRPTTAASPASETSAQTPTGRLEP